MNKTTDWTQTFFSGLMLDLLPHCSTPEQTQQEADFLAQTFASGSEAARPHILDVPCGMGRVTLALAERGFRMTGVDGTDAFLDAARRTAAERSLTVEFHRHDMRELPWDAVFDHAFCVGNSFAYFDDAGNRAFLKAVSRALKPGGKFVLETGLAAESILPHLGQRRWGEMGDMFFLHETKYDPIDATLTSGYTCIRGAQVEHKQAVYRIYLHREYCHMLREAGFGDVVGFASTKQEPFQVGSQDLWLIATKA